MRAIIPAWHISGVCVAQREKEKSAGHGTYTAVILASQKDEVGELYLMTGCTTL